MIDPLERGKWFSALHRLQARAADADVEQHESIIRHAFHLCQLAPLQLRVNVRPLIEERRFEQLLASDALELAALAIVGLPMTCRVVRLDSDLFKVIVGVPGHLQIILQHSSLAIGVIEAWVISLLRLSLPTQHSEQPETKH